jgi:L-ascorbate metabolism protein UlaG (beta-lactamase superfamily)
MEIRSFTVFELSPFSEKIQSFFYINSLILSIQQKFKFMMKSIMLVILGLVVLIGCKEDTAQKENTAKKEEQAISIEKGIADFSITPISHATAVFTLNSTVFYIDPVDGKEAFKNQPEPSIILVTDIHGDHFNLETLKAVSTSATKIVVPKAVADRIGEELSDRLLILGNEESIDVNGFTIEGIAMYNRGDASEVRHVKGRGNGYVVEKDDFRVYFSGDTEDVDEMRNLKEIDKAFICMNLPYTMDVESASEGVLAFGPKEVYPYHYRGQGGLSDIGRFKALVNAKNPSISVELLDWYPQMDE